MSTTAVHWALRLSLPPRSSSAKALLIVLSFLSRETRTKRLECFPSVGYLVEVTGQNRKTLIANLDKLERWGLLSDTGRRMGVTRQVIVYRLHMRERISTSPPQSYLNAKKRRPKTAGKTPENTPQAAQIRDTDMNIDIYKKSFRAQARDAGRTRSASAISALSDAGSARSEAFAEMEALIAEYMPRDRRQSAPMDRIEPQTDVGGDP